MRTVRTAVALFTRDLRLHDNPMLRAALDAAELVHPLFVDDDGIRTTRYGAAAGFSAGAAAPDPIVRCAEPRGTR